MEYCISCFGRNGQEEFLQQKVNLSMLPSKLSGTVSSSICAKPANRTANIPGVPRPSVYICPMKELPPVYNCVN